MVNKAMNLYMLLIDNQIPIEGACPEVGNTGLPRVDYTPEATAQQRAIGDTIAANFEQATMDVDGNTITATCDKTDKDIVFDVWNANGVLQFRQTIAAVGGVADYVLDASPGLYTVRAYGTITYASGFSEVTVT